MENNPLRLFVVLCAAVLSQSAFALGDFGGSSLDPSDVGVGRINYYGRPLDPGAPSNAAIQGQIAALTGQLGIVQGQADYEQRTWGMGGRMPNLGPMIVQGQLQGQLDFLNTVLSARGQIDALGMNFYGTVQAGKIINKTFSGPFGGIPNEDVLSYFAPVGGYKMSPGMRSWMRFTSGAAEFSANISAGFMFPPLGAARVAGAPFVSTQGVVFSGHGGFEAINGLMQIPMGTRFTIWAAPGARITHNFGNAIETGGNLMPFFNEAIGARSYLSGAWVPNLTLQPINSAFVVGSPLTVSGDVTLRFLLQPNMGVVNWAACLRGAPF